MRIQCVPGPLLSFGRRGLGTRLGIFPAMGTFPVYSPGGYTGKIPSGKATNRVVMGDTDTKYRYFDTNGADTNIDTLNEVSIP